MAVTQVKRKCSKCQTWNEEGEERCHNCGNALIPELIIREAHEEREQKRLERPRTKLDDLVDYLQQSNNPFIRIAYFIVYSIWLVYVGILAFFIWMIAWTPG